MKRGYLLFVSIFILVLHLPFVFATAIPVGKITLKEADIISASVTTNSTPDSSTIAGKMQLIYDNLKLRSLGLSQQVFNYAYEGYTYLKEVNKMNNGHILSIIDFSRSSAQKRLYIVDLDRMKVLFNTYVAHGLNSGEAFATRFSNAMESNKSSLGFYKTSDTYIGKHGYSMHLEGLERGINDNAYERDIVMHGADYVNEQLIRARGYIGRSLGCPAVSPRLSKPIIDKIKNGTCLFVYSPDRSYIAKSNIVKQGSTSLLAYN